MLLHLLMESSSIADILKTNDGGCLTNVRIEGRMPKNVGIGKRDVDNLTQQSRPAPSIRILLNPHALSITSRLTAHAKTKLKVKLVRCNPE